MEIIKINVFQDKIKKQQKENDFVHSSFFLFSKVEKTGIMLLGWSGLMYKIPGYKDLSKDQKLMIYDKPKYVYIPLINQNDTNITSVLKKGDYVYKGTLVGKRKGAFRIPILSSVSGTVVDFVEMSYLNGKNVKCVKIENDFEEKAYKIPMPKKKMNQYTREEFCRIIRDAGIIGMSGSGFPTYVKYDSELTIKTLIVNAMECEPYITADRVLMKDHVEDILEVIDAILEINEMEEAFIAIKKSDKAMVSLFNNFIGTYLKIHLVPLEDDFGNGWDRKLVQKIKHTTYTNTSLEKGIVVNNVSTIYAMYEALKYGKALTERIVTFSGDMLKNPCNVLVKIGTPVHEVIDAIGGYKRNEDIYFIAGGPMMGTALSNDKLVVTPNLNAVTVLKKKEQRIEECIHCGKCVSICPAQLSPILIKEAGGNLKRLKKLQVERCMECGLCTYICPARIDLRKVVVEAKKKGGVK